VKAYTARLIDPRQTGPIDYALMATCCCLSICATTISLNLGYIGAIYCGLLILGTLGAYAISRAKPDHWLLRLDGLVYVGVAVIALCFSGQLNFFLDDEIFQNADYVAGVMIWLMVLGSFATWRNGTLLFQTVPSLALFSLVGCWDLFGGSIVLFFIYLVCFAGLMGRVHARLMVDLAAASGYSQFHRLREGVWRWVAGPEWALGSAVVVIVLSLWGGPKIKDLAAPISGRLRPGAFRPQPRVDTPLGQTLSQGDYRPGSGPVSLTERDVLVLSATEPFYLRCCQYYAFRDGVWRRPRSFNMFGETYEDLGARDLIKNKVTGDYHILFASSDQLLPMVGLVNDFSPKRPVVMQAPNGQSFVADASKPIKVTFTMPSPEATPGDAAAFPYDEAGNWMPTPRVSDFIDQATKGATSAYQKAVQLRDAISQQARYNLRAPAVPSGSDPVDYFLFESKQGYCDLFATAMVLTARQEGIPARYVIGYLPEPDGKPSTLYDGDYDYKVREKDSHAWAELYFRGTGWTIFDPTANAQNVAGGERGVATGGLNVAWVSGGLGALLIAVGVLLVRMWRKTARTRVAPSTRYFAAQACYRFESLLSTAVRRPRRLSETFTEYLGQARPGLRRLYPEAVTLNERFERALYGEEEPHPEEVEDLRKDVARLRTEAARMRREKTASR
jgi:transglutaminase-like putative cysteine protease